MILNILFSSLYVAGNRNQADIAVKKLGGSIHQVYSEWFTWESLPELMEPNNVRGGMQANLVLMRNDKINHKIVLEQSGTFQSGLYFPKDENIGSWYRLPTNIDLQSVTGDLKTIFDNYVSTNRISQRNIVKNWNLNGLQNDAEQAGMRIFREQGLFKKDEDQILFMAIGCTSCNTCSDELKKLADEYPRLRFAFQFNHIYRDNAGFRDFVQRYGTRIDNPKINGSTITFSLCTFLNDMHDRSVRLDNKNNIIKFDEQINLLTCHRTTTL